MGAKAVAAGGRHSMMLKQDGSVWATGYNLYGQLGDGSYECKTIFMKVFDDNARMIAAGQFHSMLIKEDYSLWATGSNHKGRFGDGTEESKTIFTKIKGFGQVLTTTLLRTVRIHRATTSTTTTTALLPVGRME